MRTALELILLSSVLLLLTTAIHGMAMHLSLDLLRVSRAASWAPRSRWTRGAVVGGLAVAMLFASLIESWIWAVTYVGLGALPDLDTALYFSMVTYSSLGYGDVTLAHPWRLLSGVEAANGIMMFGWSTAVIVAAVQKVYLTGD